METIDIGIIGGSGFYQMPNLENKKEVAIETPFGMPSDSFLLGELAGKKVAFLARHNRKHSLTPSDLNYRANIYGFKALGAKYLVSASAVGSMREKYAPGHFVFPNQFIDRTRHRADTFFGRGVVAHVAFGDPICGYLQKIMYEAALEAGVVSHFGGTYLNIEGPHFSTRAESNLYRQWDVDVIGMTNLQEAKLSREAEIPYATMAMITDYDCWHEEEEDVTVEQVVQLLRRNAEAAARTIEGAVARIDLNYENPIFNALSVAIMTQEADMPVQRIEELRPILCKYLKGDGS